MAIPLTGTGGLFTRLGKVGKVLFTLNGDQSGLNTVLNEFPAQYVSTLMDVYGRLAISQVGLVRAQTGIMGTLRQFASDTVIQMVEADQPAAARSLYDALVEVRRQMLAGAATVKASAVAATAAVLGTMIGTGAIVASTKRGDGLVNENLFAEIGRVVCVTDSYVGGATAGREQFRYVGESDLGAGVYDYTWPAGTTANVSLTAVAASEDASTTGNLLTNSDFETWSGAPATLNGNNWVTTGTAGTDWAQESTEKLQGSFSIRFIADTAATPSFSQTFNASTGTTVNVKSLTSYAVNLWLKRAGTITGGVLTVDLVDGSNTVINDQQGVANSFTVTLSATTTSFAAYNGVFRLPAVLPSTVKLRFRISTALTGANLYMDDLAMTPLVSCYTGGSGIAVFSGATPFVQASNGSPADTWNLTQTNDRGGSTFLATFQALFDRLFGMRAAGLLLPSAGSPTIADTLITA